MSVASKPYFWLTCDLCGVKSTEGGEYAAWSEEDGALVEAEERYWHIEGGNHLCDDCTPLDGEDDA